jgi:hypothetical protein
MLKAALQAYASAHSAAAVHIAFSQWLMSVVAFSHMLRGNKNDPRLQLKADI